MNFGAPEMLIVLLVALIIFGPTKLPKLARSIGEAAGEFRRGHDHHPDPAPSPATDETGPHDHFDAPHSQPD